MAIDPKDLGELQRALNDAAGKASVLWTTFVVFQLYLAIAFGSVTHRDLFLETPIKLPLLNVDLPLVGFFVVAPAVLVILHFYVFLQLLGLASKANDYNTLLVVDVPDASDRQYVRQRLHVFPILQFLAGPRDQRTGFLGFSLRLIAWITLVATPVLILLQAQVTFLPYHREWVVWLQRFAVLIDLALIWYFWIHLRSDDDPLKGMWRKAWIYLGGAATLCAAIFSTYLATFPGEWLDEHLPELRYVPTTWRPHWSKKNDWTSLHALFFGSAVDELYELLSGRPSSVFSNRLVLSNQSFVVDPEKLDKITVSRSFRGRDLRLAVLWGTDLRKADFYGAQLEGASLYYAELQGASLASAHLQGALFLGAHLEGASLDSAHLEGASLDEAQLQGANLDHAQLQGASLYYAQLQGAILYHVQLQGAILYHVQLQGAALDEAQLQGANLDHAQLQGASLYYAQLQGASLAGAQLQGASLVNVGVWRAFGGPSLYLAALANIDVHPRLRGPFNSLQKPWKDNETFGKWRDAIADKVSEGPLRHRVIERLAVLDPTGKKEPKDVLDQSYWDTAHSSQ